MKRVIYFLLTVIMGVSLEGAHSFGASLLSSTEGDPEGIVEQQVNVINGDLREHIIDLVLAGPDELVLDRWYNNSNYFTGRGGGEWRFFSKCWLVIGKDPKENECEISQKRYEWKYAMTAGGEGGLLTYSGWESRSKEDEGLRLWAFRDGRGVCNTARGDIGGTTSQESSLLKYDSSVGTYILSLGDGTKRCFEKVEGRVPFVFGSGAFNAFAKEVVHPENYRLSLEKLPSGNKIFYRYGLDGNLSKIELLNHSEEKVMAWLAFEYQDEGRIIAVVSSDGREIYYAFEDGQLTRVHGSFFSDVLYEYSEEGKLARVSAANKQLEVEYDEDMRVSCLKRPLGDEKSLLASSTYAYGKGYTEVSNALGQKTVYRFNTKEQLELVERYDLKGTIYRKDRSIWSRAREGSSRLVAKTVEDGEGNTLSLRQFFYDLSGNVIEDRLYGNLTGKSQIFLSVDKSGKLVTEEGIDCHTQKRRYSTDGLNLLIYAGSGKGGGVRYEYASKTNLLTRKYIENKSGLLKRFFYFYNEDGALTKTVEDDGLKECIETDDFTEIRNVTTFVPKEDLPGVGQPREVIEERYNFYISTKPSLRKRKVNTFDAAGRICQEDVYDSKGEYAYSSSWAYDEYGRLAYEVDLEGYKTEYTYLDSGHCRTKESQAIGLKEVFSYNAQGLLTELKEIYGSTEYTKTFGYDLLGKKVFSTDRNGNRTDFNYDACGFLSEVISPYMKEISGKMTRPVVFYENDLFGNPTKTIDANGYEIVQQYNLRGEVVATNYPDGTLERFKFDPEGSLHRHLSREGVISVFEYDYLGRQSLVEKSYKDKEGTQWWLSNELHTYDSFYLKEKEDRQYPSSLYTYYQYNTLGNLLEACVSLERKDEDSRVVENKIHKERYFYDSLGRLSKKRMFFGTGIKDYTQEVVLYDLAGREVEKRKEDANGSISQGNRFIYDSRGLLIEELALEAGSYVPFVKTSYDDLGRPIAIMSGKKQEVEIIYTRVRDDAGQLVTRKIIKDANGISTEIEFDAFERVVLIEKIGRDNKVLSREELTYDLVGNKVREAHVFLGSDSRSSQVLLWEMGPMNRVETLKEAAGTPEEKVTKYSYNDLGKLALKSSSQSEEGVGYGYDFKGDLCNIFSTSSKGNKRLYGRRGIDSRIFPGYEFYLPGVKVCRQRSIFKPMTKEVIECQGMSYTVECSFDLKGRIKELLLPDQSKIQYSYEGWHGKEVVRVSREGKELYKHGYLEHDNTDLPSLECMIGFSGNRKAVRDAKGQLQSKETDYYKEFIPSGGYNDLGHLIAVDRSAEFPAENLRYTYDDLFHLSSEHGDLDRGYSFDSIGNLTQAGSKAFSYDHQNRITACGEEVYSYGTKAPQISYTRDGDKWEIETNALGQVIRVKKEAERVEFIYDPFGRIVCRKKFKKDKEVSKEFYLYVGNQEIGVLDENGQILELKVPGIEGEQLSQESVAFELHGSTVAPIYDIRGNVVALVDPQWRDVVESYTYSAFGEVAIFDSYGEEIEESELQNSWMFSGKRLDPFTKFSSFGLRFYDSVIGRWVSEDPAAFIDGPNVYGFVLGNPVHFQDLYGLSTEDRFVRELEEYFYGEVEKQCYCEVHRTCKRGGDLANISITYGPERHFVRAFNSFESGFKNKSHLYRLSGEQEFHSLPKGMIMFINGINTSFEEARSHAEYLSAMAGGCEVQGVYNASHGLPLDIAEAAMNQMYVATPPVRLLQKAWDVYFARNGTAEPLLQVCHSQGAILVRNALMSYPKELRKRITVVAIAPAAYIHPTICKSVVHYTTERSRDIVPFLDPWGRLINSRTTTILPAHESANRHDHDFQSKTYHRNIKEAVWNYRGFYGPIR